jgi:hypothetical protein
MLENGAHRAVFLARSSSWSAIMSTEFATQFSHVRPQDTSYEDQGLRDFFLYRDLGIAQATGGKVLAQLVKANHAPEQGTVMRPISTL